MAYSSADHAEGWRLFRAAAGEGELLNVPVAPAPPSTTPGIIALLDDFENKWFPRTRRIIERFVPADHRDAFSAAFFLDLKQQPLGPLVVSSVSTFLDRVEGLAKSKVPGAAAVRAELTRRGVDGDTIKRLRSAIEHARTLSPAAPAPAVDPSLALRARRAAYESLRLWWRDWRETFASEVDGRARRELGLVDTSLDPKAPPVEP